MTQDQEQTLDDLRRATLGDVTLVPRDCPMCGSSRDGAAETAYSVSPWPMRECPTCALVYLSVAPEYAELRETMAWEKSSVVEDQWRDRRRPILRKLSKATRWRLQVMPRKSPAAILEKYLGGGNVVDVGCGDGKQLMELAPQFVPFGVEISRGLAARARERCAARGGDVINAPAMDGLAASPEGFFAGAILRSYLEHERDPVGVLRVLRARMAPGGIAVVKVPNYGCLNRKVLGHHWSGFRFPDHLNYFTPATLSDIAVRGGFRADFRGPTYKMPISDNMWALLLPV